MKRILSILLISSLVLPVFAQDTINKLAKSHRKMAITADSVKPWKCTGVTSLSFNQANFSNWAAGGQNSIGLAAIVSLQANYKKGKHAWANSLDMAYGFQFLGKADFTKTNDKLEFNTIYGYSIGKHWDFGALVNFRTQFTDGFNYPNDSVAISKFIAPAYLIGGVGLSYIPVSYFSAYLSPASARLTFVLDDTLSAHGDYGVDKGKKLRTEMGPYFRFAFNKEVIKNVNLNTTLDLFTDYFNKFGYIDVNWSMLVSMKINKWLSASLMTQLIYDDDVRFKIEGSDGLPVPRTQFKELLGIGLSYTFP